MENRKVLTVILVYLFYNFIESDESKRCKQKAFIRFRAQKLISSRKEKKKINNKNRGTRSLEECVRYVCKAYR